MTQDNPDDLQYAITLLKTGDKAGARAIVSQALQDNPNLELAWIILSYTVDQPDRKRYALDQALRINPNNQKVRDLLAKLSGQQGQQPASEQASDVVHQPVERQPSESPPDTQKIVATHPVSPQDDSAPPQPHQEPVVEKTASDSDALLSKAVSHLRAGDKAAARTLLEKILTDDPQNAQAWYLASFVMKSQSGRIDTLHRTLRIDPKHQKAKERLAKLQADPLQTPQKGKIDWQAIWRVSKYTLKRGLTLFLTVVAGVYITVLIANMGGYVDELIRGLIADQLLGIGMSDAYKEIPVDERVAYMEQMEWQLEENMGLHESFMLRSARWLVNGLTFNFGTSRLDRWVAGRGFLTGDDFTVQKIVLQRLPYTLVLVGAANVLFFFASISVALLLSRRYGSWMDRISAALAALTSAPSWIFGIVLILVLAGGLQWLPFPKDIDLQYADYSDPRFLRLISVQMIMPVLAIFLSIFFQGVYTWRTFFLIYSQENYVELGRAKGLPDRMLEQRYILRPTLPYVITNFALMMIALWETTLALEILFYWPGIGNLFVKAVSSYTQTPMIIAIVVAFAYLLMITLFVLDIVYAIIDPRVGVRGDHQYAMSVKAKQKFSLRRWIRDLGIGFRDFIVGIFEWFRGIPTWLRGLRMRRKGGRSLRTSLREIAKFPSAVVGLTIIVLLIGISIYAVFAIPYSEAIELWRAYASEDGKNIWAKTPRNAEPVWFNYFRLKKKPETFIINSHDPSVSKTYVEKDNDRTDITISFPFEYDYDDFPNEFTLFFESQYDEKQPHVSVYWLTPDGREIRLSSFSGEDSLEYRISLDEKLSRKLNGLEPATGLFVDPQFDEPTPLQGTYELRIDAITFEEGSDLDAEFVLYGTVHGLAGTDHHRRDLMVALLWGTPVALAFGLLGALGTSLISMLIAAIGVWRGGWVDATIQRITEINMILPTLPIAIMIYFLYSRSIWVILGVIILLNIFGSSIKNYRAAFLQVKESAYVESAIAYGASNSRIILHYLLPRVMPILLPQLVILVPGFIFYEATLAYLGLSDPYLPTWGKVVYDAFTNGAYTGYYYWILEPVALLMLTGLAFALLGFSLDRVVNPRLRDI